MNKKIKRSITLVLSIVLLVTLTMPVNAISVKEADAERNFVCTIENEKIVDENVLLDRALRGVNDAPDEVVDSIEKHAKLSIDGVVQSEKPLVTTELLETYSNGDETQNVYAATIISKVKVQEESLKALPQKEIAKASSGENGRSIDGTDKLTGGEVSLYTVMYYATGTKDPYAYLKSVSAKITRLSTGFKVSSTQVRGGYKGIKYGGGSAQNYTSGWKTGVLEAQVSISKVLLETAPAVIWHIWGESKAKVSRGSQTWTLGHKLAEGTDSLPSGGIH